ncbi:MAG TPA: pantoate--beta-alanine ligase [Gemmatimonadales bacterium]|nr:pantoate--beta-alanine ligase [Gemmatimonadales bacterium]
MSGAATHASPAMPETGSVAELRARVGAWRREGAPIAFVPTMGYLHEGHLRLVDEARRRVGPAGRVVMSIFVNPLQFAPTEDLDRYPRDLPRDRALAAGRGVDLLFHPDVGTMYPPGSETRVVPGATAERWEGTSRPGHFAGVLTVVAKLFNLVQPDVACFGQKDFQQATLIRRMVRDLDFPIEIVVAPTVREADGLALSSRNVYLSPEERAQALGLSAALRAAAAAFAAGERVAAALERRVQEVLAVHPGVAPEYIAVTDPDTLAPVRTADPRTVVLLAARVGRTRLIDNVILGKGLA